LKASAFIFVSLYFVTYWLFGLVVMLCSQSC